MNLVKFLLTKIVVLALLVITLRPLQIVHAELSEVEELKRELELRRENLEELEKAFRMAKSSKDGYMILSVVSGALSAIMFSANIELIYAKIQNIKGVFTWEFSGSKALTGKETAIIISVATGVSAGLGYGAVKAYDQVRIRSKDLERILEHIEDEKYEIEVAEQLLSQINY